MSDLIKREDAIKAIAQDLMYESCVQSEYASDELSDWIEVAKVILEDVPSADRPQEWIPFRTAYTTTAISPCLWTLMANRCYTTNNNRGEKQMKEYIKIETPFERDTEGSKKLIEGRWRNETVEYLRNAWWVFTEKIDGTNISIVWDGHKVEFHGRTERAQIPSHLVNRLNELFGGEVNEELFEQTFGETPMILYGEGYGVKIQNGGLYRSDVDFILFDVYQPDKDIWLKREAVENIAKTFGIDVVPIILEGDIDNAIDFVKKKPMSTIGKAPMEGLVGRPETELKDRLGKRVIIKVKVKDFV